MEKIHIHPKIVEAMGLNEKEKAVFDVLITSKYVFGRDAAKIAVAANLPRTTTRRILNSFVNRKIAMRAKNIKGKRMYWKFNKGLEMLWYKGIFR